MREGHFDYGNGFHGRVYLNPHQLFRHPSTIWRLAQDLLDVLPAELLEQTEVVAGPAIGGALLAHTLAGLLDGRRALTHPPCSFAPFTRGADEFALRELLRALDAPASACCSPTTCGTRGRRFSAAPSSSAEAGGIVLATVEICDRWKRWSTSACRTTRWRSTGRRRTIRPPSARCARPASRSRRSRLRLRSGTLE